MVKLLTLVVGALLGASLLGIVLGVVVSLWVVVGLALSMLIERDWVPAIYNLRSLAQRGWTTAVTALGLALVVAVFATALMLIASVHTTLALSGSDDNAKIIRKGSQNEVQSGMLPEHLRLLAAAPETAMGKDGKPLASSELVVLIYAQRANAKSDQDGANVTLPRHRARSGIELHPPRTLEGRMLRPGTSEIVVGKALRGRFAGAELGQTMRFERRDWTVVGIMDQGGSAYDSEIWGDVEQFEDAFQRRPSFSSVTIRLRDRQALAQLQARMAVDPKLNTLEAQNEVAYWSSQSEQLAKFLTILGMFVAVIFSFGAILGAMITMYAQVAARTREIGTLRALGFRRRSVLLSFVFESVALALLSSIGGLAGAALMQLKSFSTTNFQSFSEQTFHLALTPGIVLATVLFAALMGYAGGFLPALRASRMPIVQATRGG